MLIVLGSAIGGLIYALVAAGISGWLRGRL
jgi:hypothetical protein